MLFNENIEWRSFYSKNALFLSIGMGELLQFQCNDVITEDDNDEETASTPDNGTDILCASAFLLPLCKYEQSHMWPISLTWSNFNPVMDK